MNNCPNCNKNYTIHGLHIHLKNCNKVYKQTKKKELKDDNKIKIVIDYNKTKSKWNFLPDDCLKQIYSYLLLKDYHSSYYSLYNEINNISLVCKSFYLSAPNINYMKEYIKEELKTSICRRQSMKLYNLRSDELDYNIKNKKYGYNLHLFRLVDVIQLAYDKYGTFYDYTQYIKNKELFKGLNKKDKNIVYNKRKEEYNNVFKTNRIYQDIYDKYYKYYVKYGIPKLGFIKDRINIEICKKERVNILKNILKKDDIYLTYEVYMYISYGININKAIESIQTRDKYEKLYISFLENNNIDKGIYDKIAYKYINKEEKYNFSNFLELIKEINIFNKETSLNYILKSYDIYSDFDFYNQVAKWYINNNIKKNNYSKELLLMIEKNIKKNIDTQQSK